MITQPDNVTTAELLFHDPSASALADAHTRIAALERQLAQARPLVEAFRHLEDLARERRSTPDAVAIRVTIDVLEEELADLMVAVDTIKNEKTELEVQRAQLGEDVDALLTKRDLVSGEVATLQGQQGELLEEIADVLPEIEQIRTDAVRLAGEKAQLEQGVVELRRRVESLEEEERTRRESESAISARVPSRTEIDVSDSVIDDAFDKFFTAETGKDRARAWLTK